MENPSLPDNPKGKESAYRLHVLDIAKGFFENYNSNKIIYGAEVGVKFGFTSKILLESIPKLFLYLIDTWEPTPLDHPSISIWGEKQESREEKEVQYATTIVNTRDFVSRTAIFRERSVSAAKKFQPESLDFAYIDADHYYY